MSLGQTLKNFKRYLKITFKNILKNSMKKVTVKKEAYMKISSYLAIFLSFVSLCFAQYSWQEKDMISDSLTKQLDIVKQSVGEILKMKGDLTPFQKNELVHYVLQKDDACEEITNILVRDFLQKKTTSDDVNLNEMLALVQKIIQLAYQLKLNVDELLVNNMESYMDDLKKLMAPKRSYHREYNYYRYRDK